MSVRNMCDRLCFRLACNNNCMHFCAKGENMCSENSHLCERHYRENLRKRNLRKLKANEGARIEKLPETTRSTKQMISELMGAMVTHTLCRAPHAGSISQYTPARGDSYALYLHPTVEISKDAYDLVQKCVSNPEEYEMQIVVKHYRNPANVRR